MPVPPLKWSYHKKENNEVGQRFNYQRARDVFASLKIVPKQHSSGGKDGLLGLSIHGSITEPVSLCQQNG